MALIEELRQGQAGPVRLLDEISRSLPDMLWLTEIKQQGSELTISGRCTTLTALSDFVGNLELGGFFDKPVEILDSQVDQNRGAGRGGADPVLDQGGHQRPGRVAGASGKGSPVAVSLSKLPWYGQVGAFLALSVAGVAASSTSTSRR